MLGASQAAISKERSGGRDGFVTGLGAHAPKSWQRPTSLWRTVARGALARSERARCEAIGFGRTRDEASDAKSYEVQSEENKPTIHGLFPPLPDRARHTGKKSQFFKTLVTHSAFVRALVGGYTHCRGRAFARATQETTWIHPTASLARP